jgi:hypothetical protein
MAIPLKLATASQEIPLGYFVDSTDGNTEETGLTIANTDIKLWKTGATTLANKNSGGGTHISNGIYYAVLDATDTDTYGPLVIFVHVAGALTIRVECWVMNPDAYDALFAANGTGNIEGNIVEIEGSDPTDTIRDSVVDDATRIDGSQLNTHTAITAAGIVNEWETQSQADPTGFHVNTREWLDVAVTLSDGNKPDVNVDEISDDAVAPDNLEATYDGTGYTDDDAPAKQSQLAALAITGAAINVAAESYVLTTGTQSSGTVASTVALDGTNHEHTDSAQEMDLYYQFDVGGDGVPTSITITGYLNGANDNLEVYAYNWGGTSWDQIGTLSGKATSTNEVNTFTLFTSHVGTGANLGKVRIRFTDGAFTLTTATLAVDQIFVSYAVVRRSVGYADGAIWIDTNASNTNTESYVDGTADNPVSTWAAALTLSGNLNIIRFRIKNRSSITLTGNSDNYTLIGDNWTLALGGQSIAQAHFHGADVSGTGTGATEPSFTDCHIDNVTLPPSHLSFCGLEATFTIGTAGTFFFDRCHSGVAGTSNPILNFGGALNASDINIRGYSGGIEIQNMGAGSGSYNMSLEGHGQLIINANCSATSTVAIRGHFTITDNAGGAVTLSEDARYDVDQINAQADTALSDIHLDHLLATDYDPASKPGVATALLNELVEDDGGVSRYTENALEQGPGGGGTTWDQILADHNIEGSVGNVWNDLTEESSGTYRFTSAALAEAPSGAAGTGAITFTYTLTNSVNSAPIPDATVWVTSDSAGNNLLASGTTNTSGQVVFYLDAGTVYVWRQKSGWNFDNPDIETVA